MTRVPSLQATVCSSVAGFRYCKLSTALPLLLFAAATAAADIVGDTVADAAAVENPLLPPIVDVECLFVASEVIVTDALLLPPFSPIADVVVSAAMARVMPSSKLAFIATFCGV